MDALNPLELEGTEEDIALVERGLAIMARKQAVWGSVVEGWKKHLGLLTSTAPVAPITPRLADVVLDASPSLTSSSSRAFDGTVGGLIDCYQSHPEFRFQKLRFKSRENYLSLNRRIKKDHGGERVSDLNMRTLDHWHKTWVGEQNHLAMAHSLMTMMRSLAAFGATVLENSDCRALRVTLHDMAFPMPKVRGKRLTEEDVNAIRRKAHDLRRSSVAIAQAFQFECGLRQKDVVGEWVPIGEPGTSEIVDAGEKWLRGIRWSDIDDNLILRHTTSKTGRAVKVDLKLAPMVMEELGRLRERPTSGAIVVVDGTKLPYRTARFKKDWRLIATAAGVSEDVYNMDSRGRHGNSPDDEDDEDGLDRPAEQQLSVGRTLN